MKITREDDCTSEYTPYYRNSISSWLIYQRPSISFGDFFLLSDELLGLSEALRPLYLYWIAARGEKLMPSRSDIDPITMPRPLLPNIILVDVIEVPLRFRYRVMGTAIADMLGEDWTGHFVDEVPNISPNAEEQYMKTVRNGEPSINVDEYERYDPNLMQREITRYEQLLLPLSNSNHAVSMLLGGTLKSTETA